MKIHGYRTGLYYKYNFYELEFGRVKKLSFFGELSPSLFFSTIKVKDEIIPENDILKGESQDMSNTGFSILPQIGIQYNMTSHIGIFCSGGYDINVGSKVKELDNKANNWSGLRINGGVSYSF